MIQKLRSHKKGNNKGFTLVELIVVLVILAILAAILVPALLGYIDRAKQQQIVLNAKSCLTAAQAEMSSMYGKGEPIADIEKSAHKDLIISTADIPSGSALQVGTAGSKTGTGHVDYTVTYVKYTQDSKSIYFNGEAWVESEVTQPTATYTIR